MRAAAVHQLSSRKCDGKTTWKNNLTKKIAQALFMLTPRSWKVSMKMKVFSHAEWKLLRGQYDQYQSFSRAPLQCEFTPVRTSVRLETARAKLGGLRRRCTLRNCTCTNVPLQYDVNSRPSVLPSEYVPSGIVRTWRVVARVTLRDCTSSYERGGTTVVTTVVGHVRAIPQQPKPWRVVP